MKMHKKEKKKGSLNHLNTGVYIYNNQECLVCVKKRKERKTFEKKPF